MKQISFEPRCLTLLHVACLSLALSACGEGSILQGNNDGDAPDNGSAELQTAQITRLIPPRIATRASWAQSIGNIMDELNIRKTKENVCSVIAIVDQESNFVANPEVPGLGEKAIKAFNTEVPQKFNDQFGSTLGSSFTRYFNYVLRNQPTPQYSYLAQMRTVKTEQELDLIYRRIFDYVTKQFYAGTLANAAKFMGKDIGERMNPITTLGSMQVQVEYAQAHMRNKMDVNELRDYLYTQEGGLYYGIHRLLKYPAAYDKPIYRFADYNSGMYSSRNASLQQSINKLAGTNDSLDGDMLLYNKDGSVQTAPSQTETLLNQLFADYHITMKPDDIHNDLIKEKEAEFEKTQTYQNVLSIYRQKFGKNAPYAVMPQVLITGPKLNNDYNTNWYANNVNRRYETCMHRGGGRHHHRRRG